MGEGGGAGGGGRGGDERSLLMNKRAVSTNFTSYCFQQLWNLFLGPSKHKQLMSWSSQTFKLLEHNMGGNHESGLHWSKDDEISKTRVLEGN